MLYNSNKMYQYIKAEPYTLLIKIIKHNQTRNKVELIM